MIILDVEQGSPEWFAARAGIPTASEFSNIVTASGERSKWADKYAYRLAGERITGTSEEGYSNADMERGKAVEEEARLTYEFLYGKEVQRVGLVYRDDSRDVSCSPDGLLVDERGGLEIKCPKLSTHVDYLLRKTLPADYHRQVHGSLFVTGLEWWDFFSYYPGMPPFIVRVYPDFDFMKKLEFELIKFQSLVNEVVEKIIGPGAKVTAKRIDPKPEPTVDEPPPPLEEKEPPQEKTKAKGEEKPKEDVQQPRDEPPLPEEPYQYPQTGQYNPRPKGGDLKAEKEHRQKMTTIAFENQRTPSNAVDLLEQYRNEKLFVDEKLSQEQVNKLDKFVKSLIGDFSKASG